MRVLRRFFSRLASFLRRGADEDRLNAEIQEHLALQTGENLRAGLSPTEARRQALLKFGTVEAMKESYREQTGLPFLETLVQDVRHSLRRLRKSPAFTVTTILTLALGIGATTAIFTLVHAVILQSLAVADPSALYRLGKESRCCWWGGYSQEGEFSLVSFDLYKFFRDNTREFSELAAFEASEELFGVRRAGTSDPAQSYGGEYVSGNYFLMFGLNAYSGRLLVPADDRHGAPPVAVMSYRLWRERNSSDPNIIGSVFTLSDSPVTIVGITPPGFFGDTLRTSPPDFFRPLHQEGEDVDKPDTHWLELIGRVRPGTNPVALEAQMRVELKQWLRSHWSDMRPNDRARFPQQTLFLRPGGAGITSMREEYEHWLQILIMVSGFVLLIVCANVANLMLVRGLERRRQTSLSMALGASPFRMIRQALTECTLLSFLGGAAGLAVAFAGARFILYLAFPPAEGRGAIPISASPSMTVLLFAFVLSLVTGIVFGIAPAWMATRVDPIEALRGAGRSTVRAGSLARKMLVVFQASLSLVLLSASGLLTAALHHLENQDFGFNPERRIIVNFDARLAGYSLEQLPNLNRRIEDSFSAMPGVAAVSLCVYSPLSGNNWSTGVWADGHPQPGPNDDDISSFNRATPGYFAAIGNPILRGREITERDMASSPHVAVVNEAFVRKFFHGEDALGKYFGREKTGSRQFQIVGIAKDARYLTFDLDKPIGPMIFLPEAQHDFGPDGEISASSHFLRDIVVVSRPGASVTFAELRQAMASIDPNLPIISVHTLKEQVAGTFRQQRLIARLTSFFGLLSLALACIGLYGVTAYNAGSRIAEIGVRIALGARRADVIRLILRGAFALILLGLLLGLPLSLAAGKFLGTQLYGFHPYDPFVTTVAVVTLGLAALVASLIPALRASSILPLDALRVE